MTEHRIAEAETFQRKTESSAFKRLYPRIKDSIYPRLRQNPYYGPNIKRLRGELSSIFRYRIGDYRLFYTIDPEKHLVFILDLAHRKDAYR